MLRRHIFRFLALAAPVLVLGCGGEKIHEAIHQPLLVTPDGAQTVLLADMANVRGLRTFQEMEAFIKNPEDADGFEGVLPFDYGEFVKHYQLDLFQNIDRAVIGVYGNGWIRVLVGQFQVEHLQEIARAEREVEAESSRGDDETGVYPILQERTRGPGEFAQLAEAMSLFLGPNAEALRTVLSQGLSDRGSIYHAWPNDHIWITSNSQELLYLALDLWEGVGADNLLDDPSFRRLYESRPHAPLLWVGVPETAPVPSPFTTLEAEIDVRDFVRPTVILGFKSPDEANANYPSIDNLVKEMAAMIQAVASAASATPNDPMARSLQHLHSNEELARAAETFRARAVASASIIEVEIKVPIDDFKTLFASVANEMMR